MNNSLLVITPPLLVVASVVLTRHIIVSFIIGIIWAALIATQWNIFDAGILIGQRFLSSAGVSGITSWYNLFDNWNIAIFIFLCSLGSLIVLLQKTGAAVAYGHFIQKFVHTQRSAQIASLVLSLFFFIDDYFSALTVGSVMRPLAKLYDISPLKIAFLVTAMASPVTILSPISSWVGEIILQLKQAGIGTDPQSTIVADPFYVFVHVIPCVFYAFLLILSAWYIVVRNISYGPMTRHEHHVTIIPKKNYQQEPASSMIDFLLPLITLIGSIFIILLFTGNYTLFGGSQKFLDALKYGSIHLSLLISGLVTIMISSIYFLSKQKLSLHNFFACLYEGSLLMLPSIIMLIHAWTLGAVLKQDLHTGDYIGHLFGYFVTLPLFPALCFVTAVCTAALIGSAWATIGLIFPIVIPLLQTLLIFPSGTSLSDVLLLLPVIGATLSGCIMGTHVSFIADNPIMSAASTGASHLEHIKTMAWYVLPVGSATLAAYILCGYLFSYYGYTPSIIMSLGLGVVLSITLLEILNKIQKEL